MLSFPPFGWWILAPAGPALLAAAVRGRRVRTAFAVGTVFGAVFFVLLLTWLGNLGLPPWLVLAAIEALGTGLLAVAVCVLMRLSLWPLTTAAAWVAFEAVRDRFPLGGFPWGRLAFSQAGSPLLSWAASGGAPLVTFAVAALGTVSAWALISVRRVRAAAVWAVTATLACAGAVIWNPQSSAGAATVALVQGNVPRATTLADQVRATGVTSNHAALTHRLAADVRAGRRAAPDVVIWPENSTDIDPRSDPAVYASIDAAVSDIGRPVLVGAVLDAPDGRRLNAGELWLPGSDLGQRYVKRHLVPFGEYVPARRMLGGLGALKLISRDFRPGTSARPLTAGPIRIGDVICYEVAYDDLVRSTTLAGANLLVVQSNNATYMRDGQSGETLQQLAMARLRAVEHDRSVIVATTSGVSAVIRPDGTVELSSGMWSPVLLEARVPLHADTTLADRVGAWPELLLSLLAAAGLARVGIARLRTRGGRRPTAL